MAGAEHDRSRSISRSARRRCCRTGHAGLLRSDAPDDEDARRRLVHRIARWRVKKQTSCAALLPRGNCGDFRARFES